MPSKRADPPRAPYTFQYATDHGTQMRGYDTGDGDLYEEEVSGELRLQGRYDGGAMLVIPAACMRKSHLKPGHKVILTWPHYDEIEATAPGTYQGFSVERVEPRQKPERKARGRTGESAGTLPENVVRLRPDTLPAAPSPVGRPGSTRPPGRSCKDPEMEQSRVEAWQAGPEAWTAWKTSRHNAKHRLPDSANTPAIAASTTTITERDGAMPQTPLALLAESYDDIHFLFSRQLWPQETEPLAVRTIRLLMPATGSPSSTSSAQSTNSAQSAHRNGGRDV